MWIFSCGDRLASKRKYIIISGCFLTILLTTWVYNLNKEVKSKFEGRKYVIPSRVYSAPLELVSGTKLSKERVYYELRALSYQKADKLDIVGQYIETKNQISIYKRPFTFWDGTEEKKIITLRWDKDTLSVFDENMMEMDSAVRLEPLDIGGIYPRVIEDRILTSYEDIPPILIQGLTAVEDQDFFEHNGVKPTAIARAMISNVRAGRVVQGGSTLTQQLVKNLFLTSQRSIYRKIVEAVMALLLEAQYSKEEIIETYINEVYFGQNGSRSFNGFSMAAMRFYGLPLNELTNDQIATLVGMLKGPNYYNPRKYPERTKTRRNTVLKLWKDQGIIDEEAMLLYASRPVVVLPRAQLTLSRYPDFIDLVKLKLSKDYDQNDLAGNGFRIFTSLDPYLQQKSELELQRQISRYRSRQLSGAVISIDAFDGSVLSLVSRSEKGPTSFFNRALNAKRPIGSLLKPFLYLTALKNGYTLASQISDEPLEYKQKNGEVWNPENFDKESHGDVLLVNAMAKSYNQASVRLGLDVGIDKIVDQAKNFGMEEPAHRFPSILLGTSEMTPFEVASMYQPFASAGFKIPISPIRAVQNVKGKLIKSYAFKVKRVLDDNYSFLMSVALRKVVTNGTSRSLSQLKYLDDIGAKTGTSQGERDAWFVAVGSKKLSVVWIGNDENKPIGLTGASGLCRYLEDFLKIQTTATF